MKRSHRKKTIKIHKSLILILVFIVALFCFNFDFKNMGFGKTYYVDMGNTTFPIFYQNFKSRKVNEIRGYKEECFKILASDTRILLNEKREVEFIVDKNNYNFKDLEYEVRDKDTDELIEKTNVSNVDTSKKEIKLKLNIQNLIKPNKEYLLIMKINIGEEALYYFANIIYNSKLILNETLDFITDFTEKTFDEEKAKELVKYLETSPNRDHRQLYNINIESTFEQLTFGGLKMEKVTDYYYTAYVMQEYCYNINIDYLTKEKDDKNKESYYAVKDQYVIRWDGARFYVMKFNRLMEEILDINKNVYDEIHRRLYLGITNPNNFIKKESENKQYFAFSKKNSIYLYDRPNKCLINAYSFSMKNDEDFRRISKENDKKVIEVKNNGNIIFISYGYFMSDEKEGYNGICGYEYVREEKRVNELFFTPIIANYEEIKYDVEKNLSYSNDTFYFKANNVFYKKNIYDEDIVKVNENLESASFSMSSNGKYVAFNKDSYENATEIEIYNLEKSTTTTIKAEEGTTIKAFSFLNEDLFYGVFREGDCWYNANKKIARMATQIFSYDVETNKKTEYGEKGKYFYNFKILNNNLHYNKYIKKDKDFYYDINDVIINNVKKEEENTFKFKEEWTKQKLRIGYIELLQNEKMVYDKFSSISKRGNERIVVDETQRKEEEFYYSYVNGKLISKRKIFADAVSDIRDSYGYVKLNNKKLCFNRSNKGNSLYLHLNNKINERIEEFEENYKVVENGKYIIINATGIINTDMEYFISENNKVSLFRNDLFLYFITGYDNKNYIVEYSDGKRVQISRERVAKEMNNNGMIIFVQIEN